MSVPWLLLCYTATIPVGLFLYFVLGGAIRKHFVSHFVFGFDNNITAAPQQPVSAQVVSMFFTDIAVV
ncbi:hypothetical protein Hanom_Chr01g00076331 [Helianthus anomalus]